MLVGLGQLLGHRAGAISGLKEQSSRVQKAVMRGGGVTSCLRTQMWQRQ
jgi:hypothetical protein